MGLTNWLGALGQGFGGLAVDQKNQIERARQQLLDTQNQQFHQAQMGKFAAEADKGRADAASVIQRAHQDQYLRSPEFQSVYQQARAGDDTAIAQVASAVVGHPDAAALMTPLTRVAKQPTRHYDPARGAVIDEEAGTATVPKGLPAAPAKEPHSHFVTYQDTDPASGQPRTMRMDTETGEATPAGGGRQQGAGVQGSGAQQAQQARLLAAVSEARLADERMRAYEDKLLSGGESISPLQQAGGTLSTNLSAAHTPMGAGTQALSEYFLNKKSPDYAQYLRDASTIGRAEQMMSPRGGNETMVRANALLSRAGTGAMKNTIDASRMARQALFGTSGGIEQTLTPQQSSKLKAGVQAIKRGDTGGDINLGGNELQTKYDAAVAHLTAQGKKPEEIKAVLGERP